MKTSPIKYYYMVRNEECKITTMMLRYFIVPNNSTWNYPAWTKLSNLLEMLLHMGILVALILTSHHFNATLWFLLFTWNGLVLVTTQMFLYFWVFIFNHPTLKFPLKQKKLIGSVTICVNWEYITLPKVLHKLRLAQLLCQSVLWIFSNPKYRRFSGKFQPKISRKIWISWKTCENTKTLILIERTEK